MSSNLTKNQQSKLRNCNGCLVLWLNEYPGPSGPLRPTKLLWTFRISGPSGRPAIQLFRARISGPSGSLSDLLILRSHQRYSSPDLLRKFQGPSEPSWPSRSARDLLRIFQGLFWDLPDLTDLLNFPDFPEFPDIPCFPNFPDFLCCSKHSEERIEVASIF